MPWVALLRAQVAEAVALGELADGDCTVSLYAFVGTVNSPLHDWTLCRGMPEPGARAAYAAPRPRL